MKIHLLLAIAVFCLAAYPQKRDLDQIENIVVIFAENRSFDVLYGSFPGANGLKNAKPERYRQRDRNGEVFAELPPIWPENRPFSEAMFVVHRSLGVLIAILITVHIAAALYHHFVLKDAVLKRMVSG